MNEDLQSAYEYNTNIGIALLAGFTHHRGSVWNTQYGRNSYKEPVRKFCFHDHLTIQNLLIRQIFSSNKFEVLSDWVNDTMIRATINLAGKEYKLIFYTDDFGSKSKRNYAFLSRLSHIYLNYLAHG